MESIGENALEIDWVMKNERYETELYQEQFKKIQKQDGAAAERIEAAAQRLVQYPHTYDGALKGPWSGHLKKYVGKNKYRIVFKYCEHCLKTTKEKCQDCTLPDNAVVLCAVFPRSGTINRVS